MELTSQIKKNIKHLGYEMEPISGGKLYDMVSSLGYESYGVGIKYPDGTKGVLMSLPEDKNKYNNGVYILRELPKGEIVMEVVIPNSKDKGDLILKSVDTLTTAYLGMNVEDLQLFDMIEIWGHVIAETTLKPLAKSLFPNDEAKRERFVLLYMPRLLSNAAHMFIGDDTLMEEAVNSEPYVVKMMIDQETDKPDTQDTKNTKDTKDTKDKPNNQNKTESTKA